MDVEFEAAGGKPMSMRIKPVAVNKALLSVSRLMEAGHETNLSRRPDVGNVSTGEKIPLKRT